jgi:hypothetical protein
MKLEIQWPVREWPPLKSDDHGALAKVASQLHLIWRKAKADFAENDLLGQHIDFASAEFPNLETSGANPEGGESILAATQEFLSGLTELANAEVSTTADRWNEFLNKYATKCWDNEQPFVLMPKKSKISTTPAKLAVNADSASKSSVLDTRGAASLESAAERAPQSPELNRRKLAPNRGADESASPTPEPPEQFDSGDDAWESSLSQQNASQELHFRTIGTFTPFMHMLSAAWTSLIGHRVDACLSDSVYANRMRRVNVRNQRPHQAQPFHVLARGSFLPYIHAYQRWRADGNRAIQTRLADVGPAATRAGKPNRVVVLSLDLASYYHTIPVRDLKFQEPANVEEDHPVYKHLNMRVQSYDPNRATLTRWERYFTNALLDLLLKWEGAVGVAIRHAGPTESDAPFACGLPLQLGISKVLSNSYLKHLDDRILERSRPLYYGRYVDDLFLVYSSDSTTMFPIDYAPPRARAVAEQNDAILKQFESLVLNSDEGLTIERSAKQGTDVTSEDSTAPSTRDDEESDPGSNTQEIRSRSPVPVLFDPKHGSEQPDGIHFNKDKVRIFRLEGQSGLDLLKHLDAQFQALSSEGRLWNTIGELDNQVAAKALTAGLHSGDAVDNLRRLDEVAVRRLAWSQILLRAEMTHNQLSSNDWQKLRNEFYEFTSTHVLGPGNLFQYWGQLPRLVRLAARNSDWAELVAMVDRAIHSIDRIFGTACLDWHNSHPPASHQRIGIYINGTKMSTGSIVEPFIQYTHLALLQHMQTLAMDSMMRVHGLCVPQGNGWREAGIRWPQSWKATSLDPGANLAQHEGMKELLVSLPDGSIHRSARMLLKRFASRILAGVEVSQAAAMSIGRSMSFDVDHSAWFKMVSERAVGCSRVSLVEPHRLFLADLYAEPSWAYLYERSQSDGGAEKHYCACAEDKWVDVSGSMFLRFLNQVEGFGAGAPVAARTQALEKIREAWDEHAFGGESEAADETKSNEERFILQKLLDLMFGPVPSPEPLIAVGPTVVAHLASDLALLGLLRPLAAHRLSLLLQRRMSSQLQIGRLLDTEDLFSQLVRFMRVTHGLFVSSDLVENNLRPADDSPGSFGPAFIRVGAGSPASEIRVAVVNLYTSDDAWRQAAASNPKLTAERQQQLADVVNTLLKLSPRPDYAVFPELSIPLRWAEDIALKLGRSGINAILGLEYADAGEQCLKNSVLISLDESRLGSRTRLAFVQDKGCPAPHEEFELLRKFGKRFLPADASRRFVFVHDGFAFGVMICSELLNPRLRIQYQGNVDAVMVPAWNRDAETFESMIRVASLDIHAAIALANNRAYPASCVRWPARERFNRELCALSRGLNDSAVTAGIDVHALRAFQSRASHVDDGDFKPVPEGFKIAAFRRRTPK